MMARGYMLFMVVASVLKTLGIVFAYPSFQRSIPNGKARQIFLFFRARSLFVRDLSVFLLGRLGA